MLQEIAIANAHPKLIPLLAAVVFSSLIQILQKKCQLRLFRSRPVAPGIAR